MMGPSPQRVHSTSRTWPRGWQARQCRHAAYIRVDTIEVAIDRAEGPFAEANEWQHPPGYAVGYAVASDQLHLGLDVVAESVNPLHSSRDAWRDTGTTARARVIEVEVVCSDAEEHRRRLEQRSTGFDGHHDPAWEQVITRTYAPWNRPRLVIDTAITTVTDSVEMIHSATIT